MPAVSHRYFLGKNGNFTFSNGIDNKDVKTVTINQDTAAEADVTTRGSGDEQEFAFVRKNTTIEVTVLDHSCSVGETGTITHYIATGASGPTIPTGVYQVMSISQPEELDGAVEFTVSLRKTPSTTGA
jgi:hypothetical protein